MHFVFWALGYLPGQRRGAAPHPDERVRPAPFRARGPGPASVSGGRGRGGGGSARGRVSDHRNKPAGLSRGPGPPARPESRPSDEPGAPRGARRVPRACHDAAEPRVWRHLRDAGVGGAPARHGGAVGLAGVLLLAPGDDDPGLGPGPGPEPRRENARGLRRGKGLDGVVYAHVVGRRQATTQRGTGSSSARRCRGLRFNHS
mmetsp:Transcript_27072/g.83406  ORF Transcript_27072/g.83406 Transcript_27072/m.83406 type:complete len:202 (-) Transcript_27072:1131-1736(-)